MGPIPDVITPLLWVCAVSVPLGLWKLVEIAMWAASHISVTVQ